MSWLAEIGIIPLRLTSPRVGLIPTRPLAEAGQTMEPSVSVPTATAPRFAEMAAPDPELEPQGLRSSTYGLRHCPPLLLHPLVEWLERKLAHSLMLVFPRITAPAVRSRSARNASFGAWDPSRASEPAVVCWLSPVSMLSLRSTGIPCSGPRGPRSFRSRSSASAISSASLFVSRSEPRFGPLRSSASIRPR